MGLRLEDSPSLLTSMVLLHVEHWSLMDGNLSSAGGPSPRGHGNVVYKGTPLLLVFPVGDWALPLVLPHSMPPGLEAHSEQGNLVRDGLEMNAGSRGSRLTGTTAPNRSGCHEPAHPGL